MNSGSPIHRDPRAGIKERLGRRPAYSATATCDQYSFFVEHRTFRVLVNCWLQSTEGGQTNMPASPQGLFMAECVEEVGADRFFATIFPVG